MGRATKGAGRNPAAATRRKGDAAQGSERPTTERVTFHLEERVVKRLGVHCALASQNASRVANGIIGGWLTRYGQGRQLFESDSQVAGDNTNDRLDLAGEISADGADAA